MRNRRTARAIALLMLCLASSMLFAQGIAPGYSSGTNTGPYQPGPTGTVTGTVIDQDTQHPVRLANVLLQPVASFTQGSGQRPGFAGGSSRRAGLDGTFFIDGVAPGDYYVTASAPGYVAEHALLQSELAAGASLEDVLRHVPTVHVDANGEASVVVSVQRGGAIGGRVLWDDGSPATGLPMAAQPVATTSAAGTASASAQNQKSLPGVSFEREIAVDDRGDFRLSGLAPGSYTVSALLLPDFNRNGPTYPIRVFAPGVFRRSEATPVSVSAGDERTDVRMVIPLNTLRTVSGNVSAASGSANVHSGTVSLVDSTEPTLRMAGRIASDGSFTIRNVPPGTYTMTVQGSSQEAQSDNHRGQSADAGTFAPLTQPLQVGSTDITGLAINLAPR